MEAKIQKQIIDHFSYFEEFHNSTKTLLKDCQNCAVVINKLIIRCKKIQQADTTGTPLAEFADLQNNLSASIHNLISQEIAEITDKSYSLHSSFEKLCAKNNNLQESCREENFEKESLLVKGTPFQPPLKQILELADETVTFGSEICALVDTSIDVLGVKGLNTDFLVDTFKIPAKWRVIVSEILSYTSYCSENKI